MGTFWRVLQWKMLVYICYGHLVYIKAIWYILRPFGVFYGHLIYFVVIWYIFSRFGVLHQNKSGNPAFT
jgi:hypothetical protein